MTTSPPDPDGPFGRFTLTPRMRRILVTALWIACLLAAAQRLHRARTGFAVPDDAPAELQRPRGNHGHAEIDFGGQWVLGRMIVTGHGRELYHRNRQWEVVRESYPEEDEPPYVRRNAFPRHLREPRYRNEEVRHDAEALMHWFMGRDSPRWDEAGAAIAVPFAVDALLPNPFAAAALQQVSQDHVTPGLVEELNRPALGGPLYPPVQAVLYAPLAVGNDPLLAYFTFQFLSLGLTFVTGYAITVMTGGRIWWPVATLVILVYPGYRSGLDLGQNHILSLAILAWGWACAVRGRDALGGAIWGLLAFKPVWAAAFFLVPLVMGRWRFCLAMLAGGGGLALLTLPIVGVQSWFDWLAVGREGSDLYEVNDRWVRLSRDLGGLVRRVMLDFTVPEADRRNPLADRLSWGLLLAVLGSTVGIYLWRGDRRRTTGLAAGFLFLGPYLSCYRFMYYDAILSVIPVLLLVAATGYPFGTAADRPIRWWDAVPAAILLWLILFENWIMTFGAEATVRFSGFATVVSGPGGMTTTHTPGFVIDTSVFYAWDTFALLLLWVWCGARLAVGRVKD